ncbi:MAG: 2Fe-2S iron-sulfur cluster-binding protein [Gammaproteobacteria bacterium]|nr:2Fe-2S iron-sulfur cluster-binding protein [Gammaproteobacteria bacterium]MDH3465910.1 2Fe-2S iron-sulfur cluster-binding protein [Gammaproteobacteria bacterium]
MTIEVKFVPSNRRFELQGNDTILEAALRAGLSPNYGCSNGNCGRCLAKVVNGSTARVRHHDYVPTAAEKAAGVVLMCAYTAHSDLQLEVLEADSPDDIPVQDIPARCKKKHHPTDDIAVVRVQTPRTQRLRFLSGQRVVLSLRGGIQGEYPIASCPCDDRNLEFHVHRGDNNAASRHIHSRLSPGDHLHVHGPTGGLSWHTPNAQPVVFVSCDVGFAAIKSLIEYAINIEWEGPMTLLCFGAPGAAHYMDNLARSWNDVLDNFSYRSSLLTVDPRHACEKLDEELRSSVHSELLADADLHHADVYISAPGPTACALQTQFLTHGIEATRLWTDICS